MTPLFLDSDNFKCTLEILGFKQKGSYMCGLPGFIGASKLLTPRVFNLRR